MLSGSYYEKAYNFLAAATDNINRFSFFVVSDDDQHAFEILKDIVPSFHILELSDPLDVLVALATADIRIIANSTLSAFGALLAPEVSLSIYPSEWNSYYPHLGKRLFKSINSHEIDQE